MTVRQKLASLEWVDWLFIGLFVLAIVCFISLCIDPPEEGIFESVAKGIGKLGGKVVAGYEEVRK